MLSVRISNELEKKVDQISERENMTKSDIIKEALEKYIIDYEKKLNPYELGKDLFDEAGSGQKDLSKTYKKNLKGKINEKMSH